MRPSTSEVAITIPTSETSPSNICEPLTKSSASLQSSAFNKNSKNMARPIVTSTILSFLLIQIVTTSFAKVIRSNLNAKSSKVDQYQTCGIREHFDLNEMTQLKDGNLRRSKRIVGGSSATEGEWPWQVMIKETKLFGTFTDYKCGGALISHKFVLTAAHCRPTFVSRLIVVLGQYSLKQRNLPTYSVKRMVIHKNFSMTNFHNDIALLELEKPVEFSSKISPICLPKSDAHFVGRQGHVSGWGRLFYKGDLPRKLQGASVPIISRPDCSALLVKTGFHKSMPDFFLCAGHPDGSVDACEGDSGGPLAVANDDGRWVLAGTVSHGYKCAEPNMPGIYMKVSYYRDWIDEAIQEDIQSGGKSRKPPQSLFFHILEWFIGVSLQFSTKVHYL